MGSSMMAASIGKILNIMGAKGAAPKSPHKNTGDVSELFTGMLACARMAPPAAMETGYISPAGGKGQSSNKGNAAKCNGFLGKNFKTAPGKGGPGTGRLFPGQADLRPKDTGAAKSKTRTAHFRMNPDPGTINPDAASGLQKSKQIQAAFEKKGPVEKIGDLSGKKVKSKTRIASGAVKTRTEDPDIASGLQKSKPTTGVFEKNEPTAKAADSSGKKIIAGFRDAGLNQARSFHERHVAGNSAGNENFNFETAPPKARNTGKHSRGKNDSVAPLKGDEGGKAAEIKLSHSDPNGEKIIFKQEKTAAGALSDHKRATLSRKPSGPTHSVDHKLSMGPYPPGPLRNGSETAGAVDRLTSSGIDSRALINQIASQARKTGRVRIALTPPRLGKLDMDVIVRDNKVQVILKTENSDVLHALKASTAGLESTLRNQGLMVDTIHVAVQDKLESNTFGFSQNGNTFKDGSNRENNSGPHRDKADSIEYELAGAPEEKTGHRMDGQVSLFI